MEVVVFEKLGRYLDFLRGAAESSENFVGLISDGRVGRR